MNKQYILDSLILSVKLELDCAKQALLTTASYKSSSDMKQEGKYDTRAIEASYLADAQQKRVSDLENDLFTLENIDTELLKKKNIVSLCSIVELVSDSGVAYYFLSPVGGGQVLEKISIITLNSPMGQALIQLEQGDTFELETPSGRKEFEVKSIL